MTIPADSSHRDTNTPERQMTHDSTGAMAAAWFGTQGAAEAVGTVFGRRPGDIAGLLRSELEGAESAFKGYELHHRREAEEFDGAGDQARAENSRSKADVNRHMAERMLAALSALQALSVTPGPADMLEWLIKHPSVRVFSDGRGWAVRNLGGGPEVIAHGHPSYAAAIQTAMGVLP